MLVRGQLREPPGGHGAEQPHGVGVRGAPALRVGRLEEPLGLGVPGPAQVAGEVAERLKGFGEYGTHGESTNGLHVSHLYRGRTDPRGRTAVRVPTVTLDGSRGRWYGTTARDRLSGPGGARIIRPHPCRCTLRALPAPLPGPAGRPGHAGPLRRGHRMGQMRTHPSQAIWLIPTPRAALWRFAPQGRLRGAPARRPANRRAARETCAGCTQESARRRLPARKRWEGFRYRPRGTPGARSGARTPFRTCHSSAIRVNADRSGHAHHPSPDVRAATKDATPHSRRTRSALPTHPAPRACRAPAPR